MEATLITRARSYLLWLLSRRDYPRRTLEEKLKKYGVAPEEGKLLLQELIDKGWYDEGTFKKLRTRQLIRRGFGSSYVKAKMGQEKLPVSKEEIETAYSELGTNSDEKLQEMMEKHYRRYRLRDLDKREVDQRVIQALMRKGYPFDQILKKIKAFNSSQ